MKANTIYYERCVNDGDYGHTKCGITIELEEDEKAADAFKHARHLIELQLDGPTETQRKIAEQVKKHDEEEEEIPF